VKPYPRRRLSVNLRKLPRQVSNFGMAFALDNYFYSPAGAIKFSFERRPNEYLEGIDQSDDLRRAI